MRTQEVTCPGRASAVRGDSQPARTRGGFVSVWLAGLLTALLFGWPNGALAQGAADVFGNMGQQSVVEGDAEASPDDMKPGEGAIAGSIYDGESGAPVKGASAILIWPAPEDGSPPNQEVEISGFDGGYLFPSVPPGRYTLTFVKGGYRTSTMSNFEVVPDTVNRADFPLPPVGDAATGAVLQLDAFTVEADQVGDMMTAMELRLESDSMINVMSAEDFAKFAATDVAEALTRVAGVNIVGGQFAVIRGLEDRYSSTTFNGAPVPSPDPERQSVQLDLFPSKVVSNLEVKKSFLPNLPGNSAGGSLNVISTEFPESFELKLDAAIRINELPLDTFLSVEDMNPIGNPRQPIDTIGGEFGASLGGRFEFKRREIRYKAVGAWKSDYANQLGFQENREPLQGQTGFFFGSTGDLALGQLSLTDGLFEYEQSTRELQWVAFGGLGIDLDREGDHTLDLSLFYIDKKQDIAESWRDGYVPGFDYGPLVAAGGNYDGRLGEGVTVPGSWLNNEAREDLNQDQTRGPLWFSSFRRGRTQSRDRSLLISQLNGEHILDVVEGLEISWATNFARTTQADDAYGIEYWYEPCGYSDNFDCPTGVTRAPIPTSFPATPETLGFGGYYTGGVNAEFLFSQTDVKELQGFGRLDLKYDFDIGKNFQTTLTGGGWFEYAKRDVATQFITDDAGRLAIPDTESNPETEVGLGRLIFQPGRIADANGVIPNIAVADLDQKREIGAFYAGGKVTAFEDWDFLAGVRLESVSLSSEGVPFLPPDQVEFDGSRCVLSRSRFA